MTSSTPRDRSPPGSDEPEPSPFEFVGEQLLAALALRSSRRVLAARLAAGQGQADLGDVLERMQPAVEAAPAEAPLADGLADRFGFSSARRELAELLVRELCSPEPE